MKKIYYRVIVAHAGQQSSFKRVEALKHDNLLFKYITTVYLKKKYISKLSLLKRINRDEYNRLKLRNCNILDDEDVVQYDVFPNLLLIMVNRFSRLKKLYNFMNLKLSRKFAIKVADYADIENVDALIMMGAAPAAAFEQLSKKRSHVVKIFDMTSIAYNYQGMIMQKEREKMPIAWRKYITVNSDSPKIELLMKNIYTADHLICTSKFAFQSLVENGIDPKKISIVRYGINSPKKKQITRKNMKKPLKLLFVGSVSCEKGIYFLLEAMKCFRPEDVSLTVIGKKYVSDDLLSEYENWCQFVGDIPYSQVGKYYENADVFVFPTLFDSFGKVISEAMSYGLPVISTSSAGAADYIENGINGFVIKAGSVEELENSIKYFLEHRDKVISMGKQSIETADQNTWSQYEKEYAKTIRQIILESR